MIENNMLAAQRRTLGQIWGRINDTFGKAGLEGDSRDKAAYAHMHLEAAATAILGLIGGYGSATVESVRVDVSKALIHLEGVS